MTSNGAVCASSNLYAGAAKFSHFPLDDGDPYGVPTSVVLQWPISSNQAHSTHDGLRRPGRHCLTKNGPRLGANRDEGLDIAKRNFAMARYHHTPVVHGLKEMGGGAEGLPRSEFYEGPLSDLGPEQVAFILAEAIEYFDLNRSVVPPMPLDGLHGIQKLSRHSQGEQMWSHSINVLQAMALGMPRRMEKCWRELCRYFDDALEAAQQGQRMAAFDVQDRARTERLRRTRVYFIAADGGPIKIGIAADPEKRLKALQTSNHTGLRILATVKGGATEEKAYHKKFAAHRLSGEWFERCPEIEAEISRLSTPPRITKEGECG